MTELTTIAFDIETMGFQTGDELTVIGFDSAVSAQVFLNTDGTTPKASLADRLNDTLEIPVQLSLHDNEQELLIELAMFVTSTLSQRDAKLVAYNGERGTEGLARRFSGLGSIRTDLSGRLERCHTSM